jgi:benzoate membrane transport protein
VASLVAAVCLLIMALCATTAGALLGLLPAGLLASIAGLASLTVLLEALRAALATDRPLGASVALLIAASPFAPLGISPACWALVGGLVVSWAVERPTTASAGAR